MTWRYGAFEKLVNFSELAIIAHSGAWHVSDERGRDGNLTITEELGGEFDSSFYRGGGAAATVTDSWRLKRLDVTDVHSTLFKIDFHPHIDTYIETEEKFHVVPHYADPDADSFM